VTNRVVTKTRFRPHPTTRFVGRASPVRMISSVALPGQRKVVTSMDVSRWKAQLVEDMTPRARTITDRILETLEFPDDMPWHGNIAVVDSSQFWVQEYLPAYSLDAPEITLVRSNGEFAGTASLRSGTRLLAASRRLVVALRRDSLNTTSIEILQMTCEGL
jgi:hypothetical protein